ncbi:hypothetical protein ALC60_07365 [Trachymyrmex zeteki]|uniref:Uncharacterized protein n=1 Tax=Mycetomoellerius zeteki TaxID=64791 RepID=A0A151X0F5_9HYME|nr:hypothetical protein ALC60_07365 [Trachymyrmex zeteki]
MENHERVEREQLEQCSQVANLAECLAWLQRCDECIERLEELCRAKRPRLAIGHRQCLVARIARLAGAKTQLERCFVHVGGEYASKDNRSLIWREIDTAFESRVLTGAVINDIQKFENFNNVSINVYGIEDKQILPLRLTGNKKEKHVNMLYLQDPRDDSIGHFALIKNLYYNVLKITITILVIISTFFFLFQMSALFQYERKVGDPQQRLREDDKWLEFGNHCRKERVPFTVYADLECVLRKMEPDKENASYTYQRHEVCSIGYYVENNSWFEDAANFDVSAIAPDSLTGYILEIDLEYPRHLHDTHADLPFCPMRDKPPGTRDEKLLATLYDKQRYVIHYLQQCTRHGFRITKIHRLLQFAQSPWLRDYIELNTNFRTRAKNDFEKNLYKLINNAVWDKLPEHVKADSEVRTYCRCDEHYNQPWQRTHIDGLASKIRDCSEYQHRAEVC